MGSQCAVVWDESVLDYDLGGHHPLHPVRLDLTMRLARALGVLDGVEVLTPENVRVVFTAAKPFDPASQVARNLEAIGITAPDIDGEKNGVRA